MNSLIGMAGLVIGSTLTFIYQKIITNQVIEADIKKILTQYKTEYNYNNKQLWISQIRKLISELITETEPNSETYNKLRIHFCINQIRLFLDSSNAEEKELITSVLSLESVVSEWYDEIKECDNCDAWSERKEFFDRKDYPNQIANIHQVIIDKANALIKNKLLVD